MHLVDALDADNEGQFGLGRHIEALLDTGDPGHAPQVLLLQTQGMNNCETGYPSALACCLYSLTYSSARLKTIFFLSSMRFVVSFSFAAFSADQASTRLRYLSTVSGTGFLLVGVLLVDIVVVDRRSRQCKSTCRVSPLSQRRMTSFLLRDAFGELDPTENLVLSEFSI